eukprot:UN07141
MLSQPGQTRQLLPREKRGKSLWLCPLLNSDFQSGRWVLTSQTPFPVELWQPVNGKEDCPRWIARNNFGSFVLQVDGVCVVLKDFATIWGELERHLPFANDSHSYD